MEAWNQAWQTEEGREEWLTPDTLCGELIPELKLRVLKRVLDLGFGVGRHALLLAREAFRLLVWKQAKMAWCMHKSGGAARVSTGTDHWGDECLALCKRGVWRHPYLECDLSWHDGGDPTDDQRDDALPQATGLSHLLAHLFPTLYGRKRGGDRATHLCDPGRGRERASPPLF